MKKFLSLLLTIVLLFSLAGCDALDYRKAISLYNRGYYDTAAEAFALLEGYEDSGNMITRSNYHAAIALMEEGKYSSALPRFIKLGDYEDSDQRRIECLYQIALADFEAGNYAEAQSQFQEFSDYRQSAEYLRRINWQYFLDAVVEAVQLQIEANGKRYLIYPESDEAGHLTGRLFWEVIYVTDAENPYAAFDKLTVILTRDSTIAEFSAGSTFQFNLNGMAIGSTQTGFGTFDIPTCTPDTPLILDGFEKTVTDNQGNNTTSDDPADSLMNEAMAENFAELMTIVPQMLQDADIQLTLHDIGFAAM